MFPLFQALVCLSLSLPLATQQDVQEAIDQVTAGLTYWLHLLTQSKEKHHYTECGKGVQCER